MLPKKKRNYRTVLIAVMTLYSLARNGKEMEKPTPVTIKRYDFFEILRYLAAVENIDDHWPYQNRPRYLGVQYLLDNWVNEKYWLSIGEWFADDKQIHVSQLESTLDDRYYEGSLEQEFVRLYMKHFDINEDAYLYADY